jgi:hypothetical protein
MGFMPGEMHPMTIMTPQELFEKACEGWNVELRSPMDDEFKIKRELFHEGKPLGIIWSPEVAMDLTAFHGEDVTQKLVLTLIDLTARALMGIEEEESDELAS